MTELVFPRRGRGCSGPAAHAIYREQRKAFCDAILQIRSTLDFDVGSRGWAYIMEGRNVITKFEMDICQGIVNDCRKTGELPLDICLADEARAFENRVDIDDTTPAEEASDAMDRLLSAQRHYNPISFWDYQRCYVQMLVEKSDLRSLFSGVCKELHVPIANAKGWGDLNMRAAMMERFKFWESKGRRCILLYCGDFDPGGLLISDSLRSNIQDMAGAVGWDPENLDIERFGLNYDFIVENNLTWIDNLATSKGKYPLDDPRHNDHLQPYVQDYIAQYGVRKVEANVLVTKPEAGRALCRAAIEKYLSKDRIKKYRADLQSARAEVREEIRRLIAEGAI